MHEPLPESNPYASPLAVEERAADGPPVWHGEDLPWEQRGFLPLRLVKTLVMGFPADGLRATRLFSRLRPDGRLLPAFSFVVLNYVLGGGYHYFRQAWAIMPEIASPAVLLGLVVLGTLVAVPLVAVLETLVFAGIFHALLAVTGGAMWGLPTTIRIVAYSGGCAALLLWIPMPFGSIFSSIWFAALASVGVRRVHRTTAGRALLVVVVPGLLYLAWALSAISAF